MSLLKHVTDSGTKKKLAQFGKENAVVHFRFLVPHRYRNTGEDLPNKRISKKGTFAEQTPVELPL